MAANANEKLIFVLPGPRPFCRFQRSIAALLRGDLTTSFLLYPALLPILVSVAGLLLFLEKQRRTRYLRCIVVVDALLIIVVTVLKNAGVLPQ